MDDSCYFKTVNKSRRIRKNSGEEFATNSTKPHLTLTNIAPENSLNDPKGKPDRLPTIHFQVQEMWVSGRANHLKAQHFGPWAVDVGWSIQAPAHTSASQRTATSHGTPGKISMIFWRFWEKKTSQSKLYHLPPQGGKTLVRQILQITRPIMFLPVHVSFNDLNISGNGW